MSTQLFIIMYQRRSLQQYAYSSSNVVRNYIFEKSDKSDQLVSYPDKLLPTHRPNSFDRMPVDIVVMIALDALAVIDDIIDPCH